MSKYWILLLVHLPLRLLIIIIVIVVIIIILVMPGPVPMPSLDGTDPKSTTKSKPSTIRRRTALDDLNSI